MLHSSLWLSGAITFALALPLPAFAQSIMPAADGTGTIVQYNGNTYHIEGGTQAGTNLFHSFQVLGLSNGEIADFLSNPGISNIFGRVTGGAPSVIDGLIQITGANSNLYLMNPAGIVFGQGASLNIGGDFTATTSDRLGFANGWFNATGANDYASLVGEPNQFAFLSEQPGAILNFGDLTTEQNISLVGGMVLNQGAIASTQGHITLAAVPGERLVRISEPGMLLSLEVPEGAIATDIQPTDLPTLLTGVDMETVPLQEDLAGNVVITGAVTGQQVDFYAAGQVQPTDIGLVAGDTRVIRFSETGENPDQAVFIDRRADNPEDLLYGAAAGTVSQLIEPNENGIAVISEQLSVISDSVGELDSVAIVAEGNQGNFWLGSEWIRNENIGDYAASLQSWGGTLTANADILLYSCFTALGATGEALVQSIADITGVDVAASVDATGSAHYDANWILEASTGDIEAGNSFTTETLNHWEGKLATLTVTDFGDSGAGTLRNQIAAATAGDLIQFASAGTVILSSTITWGTDNLTIDGNGGTVSGNNAVRVFYTTASDTAIRDLTIRDGRFVGGGNGGGGIFSGGNLTLTNVTVTGNSASNLGGGIDSLGALTLTNSTVTNNSAGGNGGGIRSAGAVTLSSSTVANNSASTSGGGILSTSTLNLANSTVSGNTASGDGGGLLSTSSMTLTDSTVAGNFANGQGGGLFSQGPLTLTRSTVSSNSTGSSTSSHGGGAFASGAATLTNTTISGNLAGSSGGGLYSTGGDLNINNSTIAFNTANGNGGGISAFGAPNGQITNTIVANNQDTSGGNGPDFRADLSSMTVQHNLITSTAGISAPTLTNGVNGNIIGQDPLLGPLQNNGGSTQTHALLPGSPAINAGNNSFVSVSIDQNGNPRIIDFNVDIGAYELQVVTTPLPDSCLQLGCTPVEPLPMPELLAPNEDPLLDPVSEDVAIAIDTLETVEADLTLDYWDLVWEYAELIDEATDVAGFDAELIASIIHNQGILDEIIARSESFDLDALQKFSIQERSAVTLYLSRIQALQAQAGIQPALIYFTFAPRSETEQAQASDMLLASRNLDFQDSTLAQRSNQQDELKLILMTPEGYPEVIPVSGVTREMVTQQLRRLRRGLNITQGDRYLEPAQQLYDWLIRPLRSQIEAIGIDNLAIIPDQGLRSLPVAALHDGDRFLVEDYSLGLLPSLSLIDWRYQSLDNANVLAMGASEFAQQTPLPAVPLELELISQNRQPFLNERFTYDNLDSQAQNRQFQILHLATHAQFQAGAADAAYIQLWGDETLQLKSLRDFGLYTNPPVELLILSACETAVGDADAELGFAGSALQAGVKSVLASLWQVSDLGTLALMNQFYGQLANPEVSIKAEALRQAQLALLRGDVSLAAGEINGVPLPPELAQFADTDLSHPYYWSAFTLVGSPW
ncbi:MAG: CHAT domain-containing protein [Spirulina sp. SIO3F2]|nr:CHAT domain-containing protein [Spirulina sp. SIO3F2]